VYSDMARLRREYETIDRELRALRETFNNRQDTWIKEKLSLEGKVREAELNAKKLMTIPGDREATKLKNLLKQQQDELELRTKEVTDCQDKIIQMQKDVRKHFGKGRAGKIHFYTCYFGGSSIERRAETSTGRL